MRPPLFSLIVCFITGLAPAFKAEAAPLFTPDCSSILISDGRISIDDDQDIDLLKKIPRFSSAPGFPTALLIGPHLVGRQVQVAVKDLETKFIRGEIKGSRDDWKSFDLKEIETGVLLKIQAEHPSLGVRRVEILDQDLPAALLEDLSALEAMEESFKLENQDLKLNAERVAIEKKMAWYRRWNGRNLRTTLYSRQDQLVRLEYLLSLNKTDEAMALLRLEVDNTKVPAVAIHKALEKRATLRKMQAANPFDQQRIAALDAELEVRLKEQGEILGAHYGEYRAAFLKLQTIAKNESKLYPPQTVSAAAAVLQEINLISPSADLLPALLSPRYEPDLEYIQAAFFSQPYSLMKKLEKDLWAERMTFTWMIFNKVTGQEFFRRNIDALAERLPLWARSPYNALRKSKRDMDARRFDLPQIDRIAQLNGDAAAKAEELRKLFYGDRDSHLLKSFARLADREEQALWKQLRAAAPEDLAALMDAEEKIATEWGELSKHYHQNEMNMTAAVISAGGIGSGFLYYKYGSRDSWLWQAMDALVQLLPFTGG